jgi:hypothetical protein
VGREAATVAATAVAARTGNCGGRLVAVGSSVTVAVASSVIVAVGSDVDVAIGIAVSVILGSSVANGCSSAANSTGSISMVATLCATSSDSVLEVGDRTIVEQVVMKQQPINSGTPNKASLPKRLVTLNFDNHQLWNLVMRDIVLSLYHGG